MQILLKKKITVLFLLLKAINITCYKKGKFIPIPAIKAYRVRGCIVHLIVNLSIWNAVIKYDVSSSAERRLNLMYEDWVRFLVCPSSSSLFLLLFFFFFWVCLLSHFNKCFAHLRSVAVFLTIVHYFVLNSRSKPIDTKQKRRISDSVKTFTLLLFH